MGDRNRNILVGSLLFGAILAMGILSWRKRRKSKPKFPSTARWQPIGILGKLLIFPMKSGGCLELEEAKCTELGPMQVTKTGLFSLKDRNFIIYREDTRDIILCMTYPIMVSIKIQPLSENSVLFKFRDKADLEVIIPLHKDEGKDTQKAKMWTKEKMDFLDCGDEAADWVTEVIKGDKNVEGKLRLGYWDYPRNWKSGSDENYNERGAYQNYTSYMMMSSSSLADLKERIPEQNIDFKQFRPNFLVDTTMDPYAEDQWSWLKIGEDATFMKIKDCSRCSQINIDPETSKFNPQQEPLKTLTKYRSTNQGALMGICLGLYKAGMVKVGDPVYIAV